MINKLAYWVHSLEPSPIWPMLCSLTCDYDLWTSVSERGSEQGRKEYGPLEIDRTVLLTFFLSFLAPWRPCLQSERWQRRAPCFESRIQVWFYTLDCHKFQLGPLCCTATVDTLNLTRQRGVIQRTEGVVREINTSELGDAKSKEVAATVNMLYTVLYSKLKEGTY